MTKAYIAKVEALCDKAVFLQRYNTLPTHRKAKVDRLKRDEDKRRSVGAWLLLEYALREIGIENFEIEYNALGKPYLKNRDDLFFNLSHSGEFVMCAVSDKEVGCDVQEMKSIDLKMSERFFHPKEAEALASLDECEKCDFFYRIWTLKESFIKVLGEGMSIPMREFCFDFSDGVNVISDRFCDRRFFFKEYEAGAEYKCAVCSLDSDFSKIEYVEI